MNHREWDRKRGLGARHLLAAQPIVNRSKPTSTGGDKQHGAADPSVIWNPHVKRWWMFYTKRRANDTNATGVTWVHGTRLGVAESADCGASWKYVGLAQVDLPSVFDGTNTTHCAPEVFTTAAS